MTAQRWSEVEDAFIRQCVRHGYTNRKLFAAFKERFGNRRSYPSVAKRRTLVCDGDLTPQMPSGPEQAPKQVSEQITTDFSDEVGTVAVAASASIRNPEQLFEKSGLDPDVWEMVDASPVRKWDVPMKIDDEPVVVPCYYVAIKVRKKWEHSTLPQPIVIDYQRPKLPPRPKGGVFQSVHYSDIHYPYQDDRALNILFQVLDDVKPQIVVDHGDTLDAEQLSRFPKDPTRRTSLRAEIEMAARHFATVTDLTPDAEHIWCEGNHEERLKRVIWSLAENRQAGEILTLPQVQRVLEWPLLLGLEGLGWDVIYYPGHRVLFDKLIVCHGEKARAQSGASEKAELMHYSKSGLSGHTHRQGSFYKRSYDQTWGWWGLGCLCTIRDDYVSFPNWMQGFAVVSWSPDRQNFAVEPVSIFDGVAYFRGRRYEG